MGMTLTSPAFVQNGPIPQRYTCEGDDLSPPLAWTGVPAGAASLLLICDDPDAPRGVFTHWVAFNIPTDLDGLAEGAGSRQGGVFQEATNDFGGVGYGGPCPPRGDRPHRYRFRLMAIDHLLDGLPAHARYAQILEKAKPSVIALAELVGHFGRPSTR
ncbi:YbhB/YbcL family Raf kinase inhibitor-like protein [Microvirga terricola]|uniref:YbhB/YbcL family Raf kinase inhibitor-like protein n=1 Tax=Microvirga terricola TaxID=2719797 RepID=A0ABX0VCP3_9HYPH|nr:YbhB/YbcL family Raf kinase inhibitor-like protein [Microvirga terricola]NIX77268.1 YbhB/YbcL family Raf kinase inhibitor-like protein [Microvirga terricola]